MEKIDEIRGLCDALVKGLCDALGRKLYGVYLYGAVVFPETEYTGDIDFHAVLNGPLLDAEKEKITALYRTLAKDFPAMGADMDGYFILLDAAKRTEPPEHQLVPGVYDESWALHREHILAGRYIALYGPDPGTIFPKPSWPEIESALRHEMRYIEEHIDEYPDYCILNLCRLIYSHRTRDVVVSKTASAAWAKTTFPQWRNLIDAAQKSYAKMATDQDKVLMKSGVRALHAFAVEEIARSK
jgi:hypothetical protein